jgi:hypothetical protein
MQLNSCTGASSATAVSTAQCSGCVARQSPCTVPQCVSYACTYQSSGTCSGTCGFSSSSLLRTAICTQTPGGNQVDKSLCGAQCVDQSAPCPALPCCPSYSCQVGATGSCSTTCGNGVRTTTVQCVRSCNGQITNVDISLCNSQGVACQAQSQPCSVCPAVYADPVTQLVPIYPQVQQPQYVPVPVQQQVVQQPPQYVTLPLQQQQPAAACQQWLFNAGAWQANPLCPPAGGRRSAHHSVRTLRSCPC